jgi:uncharacterized protein
LTRANIKRIYDLHIQIFQRPFARRFFYDQQTDSPHSGAITAEASMSDEMEFEWDDNKRRTNLIKHGIDFDDVREVFFDPAAYTSLSPRAVSEPRFLTVGMLKGVLVAVIFTRRNGAIRIISARVARRNERQTYGAETKKEGPSAE